MPGAGISFMFALVPIVIVVFFIAMAAVIISAAVKRTAEWKKNSESPVIKINAKVAAKRTDVSIHRGMGGNHSSRPVYSNTVYYATFETEDGTRTEFKVKDTDYGMLAEGDSGVLTYQGTRFAGFERV